MLETLYQTHREELTRYCYWICRDYELALDMVQETFLRALQNGDALEDMGPRQRRAWLYKTARNLLYDKLRRQAAERRLLEGLEGEEPASPGETGWVELEQLLWQLPPQDRALFQMRYLEGYNATELGDLFDEPPSTIRARLARIRKRLFAMLSEG